jgi:hypothetical protein
MTDQLDSVLLVEVVLTAALIGVIPAFIVQNKGHSFFAWWVLRGDGVHLRPARSAHPQAEQVQTATQAIP